MAGTKVSTLTLEVMVKPYSNAYVAQFGVNVLYGDAPPAAAATETLVKGRRRTLVEPRQLRSSDS